MDSKRKKNSNSKATKTTNTLATIIKLKSKLKNKSINLQSNRNSKLEETAKGTSQESKGTKGTKESKTSTTLEPDDIKAGIFGSIMSKVKFPAKFKEKYIKVNKEEITGECFYCLRPKCYVLKPSCGHGCCYTCSSFLIELSNAIDDIKGIKCLYCGTKQITENQKTTLDYLKYCFLNFGPDYGNENIVNLKDGKSNMEEVKQMKSSIEMNILTNKNQYCHECNELVCFRCLKQKQVHQNHNVVYIDDLYIDPSSCNFDPIYSTEMELTKRNIEKMVETMKRLKDLYLK